MVFIILLLESIIRKYIKGSSFIISYMNHIENAKTDPCFETNFNHMRLLVLVLYSFNNDVDTIRKYARTKYKYGLDTCFGVRTVGTINTEQLNMFKSLFGCMKRKMIQCITHFLFITKYKLAYNHMDDNEEDAYAAVCYLNDKPLRPSGLNLYDNSDTTQQLDILAKEYNNNITDIPYSHLLRGSRMKNQGFITEECNKLVLYKSTTFHHIYHGYGENASNCRAGQTFFMNTKVIQ